MVNVVFEKHNHSFRIIFNEEYSCLVTDYQGIYCLVRHTDNRGVFDTYVIPYRNFGVGNINELFCLLIREPRIIIRMLTQNDLPIDRITVEYHED
jgi:hypothetical protein